MTYVYLWAANDMAKMNSTLGGVEWVMGVNSARISPAELAGRLISNGRSNFEIVGEFAP